MRAQLIRAAGPLAVACAFVAPFITLAQGTQAQPPAPARGLAEALASFGNNGIVTLPAASAFATGDRTVGPKEHIKGTLAVSGGTVHVKGIVDGDVVSFAGDVIVETGGQVNGNAVAIEGKVTIDGGSVTGEAITLGGDTAPVIANAAPTVGTRAMHELMLAAGWFGVLFVIGIGVMLFASPNLHAVTEAVSRHYGRALVAGMAGQLAALPVLALITLALTLSVVGILLIPFAIVAYAVAAAGVVTLGYLAAASVAGSGWMASAGISERDRRAANLRSIVIGLAILLSPWFLAAALGPWPTAEAIARAIGLAITWVAATVGLGGAMISRGGVRRAAAPEAQQAIAAASWQTPTPVSGVAAARRPTPMSTGSIK